MPTSVSFKCRLHFPYPVHYRKLNKGITLNMKIHHQLTYHEKQNYSINIDYTWFPEREVSCNILLTYVYSGYLKLLMKKMMMGLYYKPFSIQMYLKCTESQTPENSFGLRVIRGAGRPLLNNTVSVSLELINYVNLSTHNRMYSRYAGV